MAVSHPTSRANEAQDNFPNGESPLPVHAESENSQLITVDFNGDDLQAMKTGDSERDVLVSAKRVCKALSISWSSQYEKLRRAEWAVISMIGTTGPDGKQYETAMISLQSLPMWLATIQTSRVSEEARPKLVKYQKECAIVLARHFLGERIPADEIRSLRHSHDVSRMELTVLQEEAARQSNLIEELLAASGYKLANRSTRELHAKILEKHRRGLCPTCDLREIVFDGKLIQNSRVIHVTPYRTIASALHTMPVCLPCFGKHTSQQLVSERHDRVSGYLALVSDHLEHPQLFSDQEGGDA